MATQTPVTSAAPAKHCSGCSLLTWKNPQETAKVFGGAIAALLLVKYVNLLNLFFRLSAVVLFASGAAEYVGKLVTGQGFASRFRPAHQTGVISELAKEYSPKLVNSAHALESNLCGLLFSADVEKTLKASFGAYLLYKITSWFSLYTLVFTAVVVSFTAPVAYVTYEKEIHAAKDKYYLIAKTKAGEYRDLAHEQAKPYVSQVSGAVSPYTLKLAAYLPKNRTAGSTVGASPVPAAKTKAAPEPAVGTASGSSVHETAAFPTAPSLQPLNAAAVEAADLKTAIQKDKAAAAHAL